MVRGRTGTHRCSHDCGGSHSDESGGGYAGIAPSVVSSLRVSGDARRRYPTGLARADGEDLHRVTMLTPQIRLVVIGLSLHPTVSPSPAPKSLRHAAPPSSAGAPKRYARVSRRTIPPYSGQPGLPRSGWPRGASQRLARSGETSGSSSGNREPVRRGLGTRRPQLISHRALGLKVPPSGFAGTRER